MAIHFRKMLGDRQAVCGTAISERPWAQGDSVATPAAVTCKRCRRVLAGGVLVLDPQTGVATKTKADVVTAVVAWVTMEGLQKTNRMERFDGYNYRPVFEACEQARALVWLRHAGPVDVAKARAYANQQAAEDDVVRAAVYTFPTTERDPLGKAKRRILETK